MTKSELSGAGVLSTRVGTLQSPFLAITRLRSLTYELARTEILGRYRGASFGLLWSLLSPFLMLGIYAVAFGQIMQGRWPQQSGGPNVPFALVLFLGIVIHGFLGECLMRAPQLMIGNANYVKKVVFPLEVLPWSMVLTAMFHLVTNLVVFVGLLLVFVGHVSPWLWCLPLVLLPLVLLALTCGWLLASLGVYLRDLVIVMPIVSTALFFLSSAIMPVDSVPVRFQIFYRLNPLTFLIDQARDVALWGRPPQWASLVVATIAASIAAYLSVIWFRKVSRGFADVL